MSTAAGLEKDDSQTALDLSNFIAKAARAYVYARLTSAEGVEGFEIRFGTTANDYFRFIATTQNDATVFVDGINFVSFDLRYPGVVGSPDWSNIAYRAVFIKKDVSKVEEGGYAFNLLQVRSGIYATIRYYSLFGWRNQNGTYKVESDQPTDIVVAQQDEYDLYVKKGRALAARETDLPVSQIQQLDADYQAAVESYNMRSIDESKAVITSYFEYGDDIHEGYPQVV